MRKEYIVEDALNALRSGRIIMVSDDENRENETDFICAGEFASPQNINFMATYGKGLICTPMSPEISQRLGFVSMVTNNTDNHETAFTVSVDHKDSTTGISAFERSNTILKCADSSSVFSDFRTPGHVFPLVSRPVRIVWGANFI